jgi:hypothetical protein
MPVTLTCECGKRLRIPDGKEGKRVKCPGCGQVLAVPDDAASIAVQESRPSAKRKSGPPLPVDGIVYGRSVLKTLGLIVLCMLLFLFGSFCIWAKVTGAVLDAHTSSPKEVTWVGLLFGIVAVVSAPAVIVALVRAWWVRRRLIIGDDCLQLVEHLKGEDTVVLQIPYANIADFQYETTKTEYRVGIDLRDLDDPNTYARFESFFTNQTIENRHYSISDGYQGSPKAIHKALKRAYKKWEGSR